MTAQPDANPLARIYSALRAQGGSAGTGIAEVRDVAQVGRSLGRLCQRLGVVNRTASGAEAARSAEQALAEAARAAAEPVGRVRAVLAEFCSDEEGAAICGEVPRCGECPVAEECPYPDRRPTIKDMPEAERPRERLLRGGAETLSEAELLALIIGGGSARETAIDLGRRLMSRFGSLRRLAQCSPGELKAIHGIGDAKAARIRAALEIARRYSGERLPAGAPISGSAQLFNYMREKLAGRQKEFFVSVLLDIKHRIIREDQVSVGSLSESVVHPREVFKNAIRESAAAVIFVHNHPSGNPQPSPQDRRLTARLCRAGELVGIPVLDHMIVGRDSYFSFGEEGLLDKGAAGA